MKSSAARVPSFDMQLGTCSRLSLVLPLALVCACRAAPASAVDSNSDAQVAATAPGAAERHDARSAPSAAPAEPSSATAASIRAPSDPTQAQVVLGTLNGWRADLALDLGATGIWTVKPAKVFAHNGCSEIVALDDLGRCHVLWSYSGKWSPITTVKDGAWLGGLCQGDVDPRVPGVELYVAGKTGNVFEIVAYPDSGLDHRRVANLERREVHTLIAADVAAETPGEELLAFTSPGALFLLAPRADGLDGFETVGRWELAGRVRDVVRLPATSPGDAPEFATASRDGAIDLLRLTASGPELTPIHRLAMGRGRVALRPSSAGGLGGGTPSTDSSTEVVLYSTADDGTIWRHARVARDEWKTELVYAGPQGPRGIATGRFLADPDTETLVVFGYDRAVELLVRNASGWTNETIFEDRDAGHWITAAEVDGRNATDEIVCSGYGGRVVLLSRPPGFGLPHTLSAPDDGASRP